MYILDIELLVNKNKSEKDSKKARKIDIYNDVNQSSSFLPLKKKFFFRVQEDRWVQIEVQEVSP